MKMHLNSTKNQQDKTLRTKTEELPWNDQEYKITGVFFSTRVKLNKRS